MQNQIHQMSQEEFVPVKQQLLQDSQLHYGEIDGSTIQNWEEYRDEVSRVFRFPNEWVVNMAGYDDWMTDLSWLEKEKYVMVISNYSSFLEQDRELRNMLINGLRKHILPFWEEEVEHAVVDGRAKSFQVYLID